MHYSGFSSAQQHLSAQEQYTPLLCQVPYPGCRSVLAVRSRVQESVWSNFHKTGSLDWRWGRFFAVLDPPQDWTVEAENRTWWQEYNRDTPLLGASYDDPVLVRELARLFGVHWSDLPALVVSTNLWGAEFTTIPTNPWLIEQQFQILTDLVDEWGKPNIDQIADVLSDHSSVPTAYHPPDRTLQRRLGTTYSVLACAPSEGKPFNGPDFQRIVGRTLNEVDFALEELRSSRYNAERRLNHLDAARSENISSPSEELADRFLEDIAGQLVAPATVATEVAGRLTMFLNAQPELGLEEEAAIMVETSIRVGNFQELSQGNEPPFRFRNDNPRFAREQKVDFSPGCQGAWKAFELEANLSVIQAVRAACGVKMPELFRLFDPRLPHNKGEVHTGANTKRLINQPDRHSLHGRGHRFLPLGDALYVTRGMINLSQNPTANFEAIIQQCLHCPLPDSLLGSWQRIVDLRNFGSHAGLLTFEDYKVVLDTMLDPITLQPLLDIKRYLSRPA